MVSLSDFCLVNNHSFILIFQSLSMIVLVSKPSTPIGIIIKEVTRDAYLIGDNQESDKIVILHPLFSIDKWVASI